MRITLVDSRPIFKSGIRNIISNAFEHVQFCDYECLDDVIHSEDNAFDLIILTLQSIYDAHYEIEKYIALVLGNYNTLVLTSSSDYREFKKLMALNIKGYLRIDAEPKELIYAIKAIQDGMLFIDSSFVTRDSHQQTEKFIGTLTPREHQIFQLIGKGLSNSEISESLFISINTVKKHVNRIIHKLEVRDRIQVLLVAKEYL